MYYRQSNITATSADIDFSSFVGGAQYTVEYGPAGFTQGTGTTINGTAVAGVNTVSISGLSSNATAYDVYVYDDCPSNIVGPYTFETAYNNPTPCNSGGSGEAIIDNSCPGVNFLIEVTGENTELGTDVELREVSLIIEHPNVGDLDVTLVSPNGTRVACLAM